MVDLINARGQSTQVTLWGTLADKCLWFDTLGWTAKLREEARRERSFSALCEDDVFLIEFM